MLNDATRILSVITKQVEKRVKSGAAVELTYGQVYGVGDQECSVYLAGQREIAEAYGEAVEPTQGFRLRGFLSVNAGDYVKVSLDDRGHKWVEDVIPTNYPKIAVNVQTGGIMLGNGVIAPAFGTPGQVPTVDPTGQRLVYKTPITDADYRGASLRLTATSASHASASTQQVLWDAVEWDTVGLVNLASNAFVIPTGLGGLWRITVQHVITPSTTAESAAFLSVRDSGGTHFLDKKVTRPAVATGGPIFLSASKIVKLPAGAVIKSYGGNTGQTWTHTPVPNDPDYEMFFQIEYISPNLSPPGGPGAIPANAILKRIEARTFNANSILRKLGNAFTFTADAYIYAPVDLFFGATGGPDSWYAPFGVHNVWFDNDLTTIGSVGQFNVSPVWDIGTAQVVNKFHIWWDYGTGDHPGSGAAGRFYIRGSNSPTGPFTDVLYDADPVTHAGVSFPQDFDIVYTVSDLVGGVPSAAYRYWRFDSPGNFGNNDIKQISAYYIP